MGREVGGGIGMGKTCEPKAFSFQCMTKFTTNKKKKKNNCHLVIGMETQSCTSFLIERVQRACCEFLGFIDRPQGKPPGHQEGSEGGREGACRRKACVYSQSLGRV